MKKTIVLLSLVLMIVVSLVATTLFKPVSYEIPPQLQKVLDENNIEIASRVSNNLYLTTDGSYIQGFPMTQDSDDIVDAAIFSYDTTAADGHVYATNTTYSNTHDAASGTVDAVGGSIRVGQVKTSPVSYTIYRGALFFDTSAIPDTAIISQGIVSMEVGGDYSENDFYIYLVSGDNLGTSLTATDYAVLGTTDSMVSDGAWNTNTSFTVGQFANIGLNAAGINDISLNGTTAFGIRSHNDVTETAPVGSTLEIIYPESLEDEFDNPFYTIEPIPGHYDKWECVNEYSPNSNTDYVYWTNWAAGWYWESDVYGMTDVSAEAYGSNAPTQITVYVWYRHYPWQGSSAGLVDPGIRVNSTVYSGSDSQTSSQTYVQTTRTWTTNPNTSLQWTWDEVNALEGVNTMYSSFHGDRATAVTSYSIGATYIPANAGNEYVDFSASEVGLGHIPYLWVVYQIGNVPTAPTDLLCNDEEHPVTTDYTPYFSAVGHHVDAGATMNWYSIQVDDQQSFASPLWSSGQVAFTTNISDGERCEDIEYIGLPFTIDTRYYWRIAFYDQDEDISPWSSTSWFDIAIPSTCPENLVAEPLSHNEIRLTWDNADSDFTYGALYFQEVSYPGAMTDGTRLYLGPGEAYTHKGLEAGTNYYYRVWGYDSDSGNYSTGTCYTSDWATTLAGETDGPTPPLVPPEWSQYPTCEVYEGVPFIHDLITDAYATNGSTTHYGVPDETACLLCTFGFLLMFGLTGYFVTRRNELVLVGILCVGIIAASIAGAMPMWFIAFAVVGAIYLFVKVRA